LRLPIPSLFPYTTLFRSVHVPNFFAAVEIQTAQGALCAEGEDLPAGDRRRGARAFVETEVIAITGGIIQSPKRFAVLRIEAFNRSEEHTSELQSRFDLVC